MSRGTPLTVGPAILAVGSWLSAPGSGILALGSWPQDPGGEALGTKIIEKMSVFHTFWEARRAEVVKTLFYEVVEPEIVTGLVVHSSYLRNQEITFEVFDADGNNITIDSNFIVDGISIVGNQISYPEIGIHQVYAEYSIDSAIYNSDTRTFSIVIPSTKVVLEDYTGTWCGYCPNVSHAIEEIRMITDDISVVAIHSGDEMTVSPGLDIINEFNITGYPTARINRTIDWPYPYASNTIESLIDTDNSIGISIKSEGVSNEIASNVTSSLPIISGGGKITEII